MKKTFVLCLIFLFTSVFFGNAEESAITTEWIDSYRMTSAFPKVDDTCYRVEEGVLYYNNTLVAYPEGKKDAKYKIIDGTECIADNAFANNDYIEKIVMPNSVVQIGESAFNGCASLLSVILSDRLLIIGGSAFCNCRSLEAITLPPRLYAIGAHAFSETAKLKQITIPESVRYVGDEAFSRSAVCQIIFEGWIESIGICLITPSSTYTIEIIVPSDEFYYVEKLYKEFDDDRSNVRITIES